jgi:integrase
MARKVTPLTATQIKNAKPKDKAYTLPDGNGLQLLIKPDGKKLWEYIYKSPTLLKRRKTSFGLYDSKSNTLAIARDKANDFRKLVHKGIDPIDNKKEVAREIKQKENSNFKVIADEWLEFEAKKTAPTTHKRKIATFDNDVFPIFKNKSINDINHQDIIDMIKKKSRKGTESANKLFRYLNNVWKFAITKGLCKSNPFNDIEKDMIIIKQKVKHRPKITHIPTLTKLIKDLYSYQGHISTRNALCFVLHTPIRPDNLYSLKWKYIDTKNKKLTIPRTLMKDDNINLPDFTIPLTDEAINILEIQRAFTGHQEYIFTGNTKQPISDNTTNQALKRLGYIEKNNRNMTTHGFRGIFRSLSDTLQDEHNCSYDLKELALDHHTKSNVVKAYNHQADYFEQLKPLMQWWSDFIVKLKDAKDE